MKTAPFDLPETQALSLARKGFLDRFVDDLRTSGVTLESGADIGCGFGYFTTALVEKGLHVTAVDARPENVAEAQARNPTATARVYNVEDARLAELGKLDLVVSMGLVYHLENPFLAMRNLREITGKVLLVESVCAPGADAITVMYQEDEDVDQGVNYVAMVPTEAWLINAMYVSGFGCVCRPLRMPDHPDFRPSPAKFRRRTILVASHSPIDVAGLELMKRRRVRQYLWDRLSIPPLSESGRIRSVLRRTLRRL